MDAKERLQEFAIEEDGDVMDSDVGIVSYDADVNPLVDID